jgi:hypothetical protein
VGKDVQVVLKSEICFMNIMAGGEYGCVVGVGPERVLTEVGMSAVNKV